jgi:V8-like Glu-specific endopeptidase
MRVFLHFFCSTVLFFVLAANTIILGQTAEIPYHVEPFVLESGIYNGNGSGVLKIFSETIEMRNAPWLQLHFSAANLGRESYIKIRSDKYDVAQKLDAVSIEQWNYYSAFFNGDKVELELYVGATDNNIFINVFEIVVGDEASSSPFYSICGPTDDRIPSNQPATARLINIGCTSWIIPNGKMVSAGHCLDGSGANVVEFNVPLSLPNGTIQHPGPEDQYTVDVSTKIFTNGGVGNDWGVFEVYPNSVTGLMPKEAQNAYWPLVQNLGPDSIRITGYGVDDGTANQTQQTHIGPNAGSSGTTMRYVTDTQGGNSGSPVIDGLTNEAVGVHTHGGCTSSGGNNNGTSFFHAAFWAAVDEGAGGVMTIAQAIEDLDNDLIPDRLGDTVTVQGIVFTPNYQTTHNSFFIDDGTAGADIFTYGPPVFTWNLGDKLEITGVVDQFNGLTEIAPMDSSGWVFISGGNPLPSPIILTIDQYLSDPEMYEGSLIAFQYVSLVGGTWPNPGSSATLQISDGIDTVDLRIDSDTDIDDNPEPTWPQDVVGVGSQYCSGGCVDAGYQLMPRFYTDFLPPGTIPVELVAFSAHVSDATVSLSWLTETELNNSGFMIERRLAESTVWNDVAFVQAKGNSTETVYYNFEDTNLNVGTYVYRLKQMDFDGSFSYSNLIEVDVLAPQGFTLYQNYPNPFNPTTNIKFALPYKTQLELNVYNSLGERVAQMFNGTLEEGYHEFVFDASNLSSGVYFYRIESDNFVGAKKMAILK